MFLAPIPVIILGTIPFIFVVSAIYAFVAAPQKSFRMVWLALFALAIWTLTFFNKVYSTVLDRGGHSRRMEETRSAWEKTQVFEDVVEMPITYIKRIIDHFRVMFGGTSAYERRVDEYLDRVTWVDGVDFHLWDAAPMVWGKIAHSFAVMPLQSGAVLIAILLAAYYAPAIARRKQRAGSAGLLQSLQRSEINGLRRNGASPEELRAAEAKAQRALEDFEKSCTFMGTLAARTRAAPQVLNPFHHVRAAYRNQLSTQDGSVMRAVFGVVLNAARIALALLVGYLMALFVVGYLGLMLLPYIAAAGPVFGAILGMIFAIGLFGGVLRVGGMNFIFFMRS